MPSYSSYTEVELLTLLQCSDEGAFTELYDRYWKKLLARANLLLHSQEDAEEIVHDIFVRIWQKRETLKIINTFHTYVAAMLQYGCFKILAQRKVFRMNDTTDPLLDPADKSSTQEWLDFEYLRRELENAVLLLPDKCQLIFRLSREQGLSDKAIAEKLNVSVNTVRTQMHRALQKLKTSLNSFFAL